MNNIIGLREKVIVSKGEASKEVLARIDTGAASNSIDIELAAELNLGPILDTALVKSANGHSKRAIVKANLEIKGIKISTNFTIADRSRLRHPVLVGRKALKVMPFLLDPKK